MLKGRSYFLRLSLELKAFLIHRFSILHHWNTHKKELPCFIGGKFGCQKPTGWGYIEEWVFKVPKSAPMPFLQVTYQMDTQRCTKIGWQRKIKAENA